MSSAAKRIQEQRQSEQQKTVQTVIVHKARISVGEMLILSVLTLAIVFAGIKIISTQSAIYEANREIQETNVAIEEQMKVNKDLNVQVSELSTYERIWQKAAEFGLVLDENNVKVVQK